MASLDELLAEHPEWYHSIELAPGIATPGRAPLAHWEGVFRQLRLPPLEGRSVLDIGAFDGFFSFACERAGASRVVALDHYVWSTDLPGYMKAYREARAARTFLPAPHESPFWNPEELPGRRPFDAARRWLESRVEPVVGDFMTLDAKSLGSFDVVLLLGVLYHLTDPVGAVSRAFELTRPGGLCVIETEAMEIPWSGSRPLFEFFPGDELMGDTSNWWAPNRAALLGLCRAAGFEEVEALPPIRPYQEPLRRVLGALRRGAARTRLLPLPLRYRLAVHARRPA